MLQMELGQRRIWQILFAYPVNKWTSAEDETKDLAKVV